MSTMTKFAKASLPPLEQGDCLTRDEFERRYHAMPGVRKAELIEGKVYMPSPVRRKSHGEPDNILGGLLYVYSAATPGVRIANNATVRLDKNNEPQPDADLRIEEAYGGQATVSQDDYLEGAPELVVEIAASTAAHDLHDDYLVEIETEFTAIIAIFTQNDKLDFFLRLLDCLRTQE